MSRDPFGPRETDEQLSSMTEALSKAKGQEDTVLEGLTSPIRGGIPTYWRDEAGKTHLKGADAKVVVGATQKEIQSYGFAPTRVCGTCKYFTVEHARKAMVQQKFLHRLVREETWKTRFLGVPADHVGLCGASDGSKAVTSVSNAGACDQWRPSSLLNRLESRKRT